MAFIATVIMRVMTKYPWLSYFGLVFLIYLSGDMLWSGWFGTEQMVGMKSVIESFMN